MSPFTVREARVADLPAIDRIYDHYVLHSTCTAQTEPAGLAAREAWFADHDARHPIVVAQDEASGAVLGWGSLSVYNRRAGYADTVEDSVYVDASAHRRGIGSAILAHLLRRAAKLGHHAVVAAIAGDQAASLGLHERHGFATVGTMPEVIRKFGSWIDLVFMLRRA